MPDSHLNPKLLHLRLAALEREFPKQVAWCRACKAETQALVRDIALENTDFKRQVAEHHARVTRLLKAMGCDMRRKTKP